MRKLADLTKKRRDHVESCRKNGDHSHEVIANLYSDSSHFIYELMQNADDAGASRIAFRLTSESLVASHNGDKLFDFDDIEAITTIGSSTKKDDVNSIGKFGVGFKSVFAITRTPIIHSGEYHFKIADFIVPEEVNPINNESECTQIILQFNHPDVSSDEIYEKVSDRLRLLESESLLFLRNIKEIKWKTESDSGHYMSDVNGNKASLISQTNNEEIVTEYFLVRKDIEIDTMPLNIVVAYKMNEDGNIVPIDNSRLFVYFPTNERTGLKFLVHAKYKTTPSRETIPFDDSQNEYITAELSSCITDSMVLLKNNNLLTVDVISMLPIDSREDHILYRAAFNQVKSAFESKSLLPTSDGSYVNSSEALLARESELVELLKDDCQTLFHKRCWLSANITERGETQLIREYLTKELNVPLITMESFCSTKIDREFLATKSDEWLVKFYSRVANIKSLYRESKIPGIKKGVLRERPIIRLEDDSHMCPENESGELHVYLPLQKRQSKFKTVKSSLVKDKDAYEFLESLGLKKPDSIAEIKEFLIPKYRKKCVDESEYKDDFNRVLDIWMESKEHQKQTLLDELKNARFIRCKDQGGNIEYRVSNEVYFQTDELLSWFSGNSRDKIYFLYLPFDTTENGKDLMKKLGVKCNLEKFGEDDVFIDSHGRHERSVNGFNPRFNIHGLGYALENITFERSLFLWSLLLGYANKLRGYVEVTTNLNRPYRKSEEQKSDAMNVLCYYKWLYNNRSELIDSHISDISFDDLSDCYEKDHENIERFTKALGLKLDEIREIEEKTGKKLVSQEDYELLQKVKQEQSNNTGKSWKPEFSPDEVAPIEDETDMNPPPVQDLSGQGAEESKQHHGSNTFTNKDSTKENSAALHDKKNIGEWGEAVANGYLQKKHSSMEVIWLNENGNTGKGHDFVVKNGEEEIAYYEVKTKIDNSPQLFQMSGVQWNWARELYDKKKGDMYKILLISNAGSQNPVITTIENPVKIWKSGELDAHPVNIRL